MTKVSVSFVANLSDLPALFSTLGPSLSLCEDLKVESIMDVLQAPEMPSLDDLKEVAKDIMNRAQTVETGLHHNTAPKTPGLTRDHTGDKPRGERQRRLSEEDYRRSRVQTLIYERLVEAGYNIPVPYPVLEQVLVDNNYAPKSMSPALTMLYKQGLVDRINKTAWALTPVSQRPKGGDEPELPLGTKSDG